MCSSKWRVMWEQAPKWHQRLEIKWPSKRCRLMMLHCLPPTGMTSITAIVFYSSEDEYQLPYLGCIGRPRCTHSAIRLIEFQFEGCHYGLLAMISTSVCVVHADRLQLPLEHDTSSTVRRCQNSRITCVFVWTKDSKTPFVTLPTAVSQHVGVVDVHYMGWWWCWQPLECHHLNCVLFCWCRHRARVVQK